MKIIIKNFWFRWILAAMALVLAFNLNRNALAGIAWENFHWPEGAIVLDRSDADLAMFIGNFYFGGVLGSNAYDLDTAEKAYRKAAAINPAVLWGHYQLARIYFIENDFYKAIEEINAELKHNPQNLRSLYVRGLIFGFRGDLNNAEEDFKGFIKWAPKEWAGYNDLAWILSKKEKYFEAKKTIEAAFEEIESAESNPWLWNGLGLAELNLGNFNESRKALKKAVALAEKLTVYDWQRAYPGNQPEGAEAGIAAFKEAIRKNLAKTR